MIVVCLYTLAKKKKDSNKFLYKFLKKISIYAKKGKIFKLSFKNVYTHLYNSRESFQKVPTPPSDTFIGKKSIKESRRGARYHMKRIS